MFETKVEPVEALLAQADLLRMFKQGKVDETEGAAHNLDFESIMTLLTSPLKVVQKKILSKHGSLEKLGSILVTRASEQVNTPEQYKRLMDIVRAKNWWSPMTWGILTRNTDTLHLNDVIKMGEVHGNEYPSDNADFFNSTIKRFKGADRFSVCSKVTEQFLLRMNEDERIDFLKTLQRRADEFTGKVQVHFNSTHLDPLYIDLDYSKVRPILDANPNLLAWAVMIIWKQNDKELAEKALKHQDIESAKAKPLFTMLPLEAKLRVVADDADKNQSKYSYANRYCHEVESDGIFSPDELPALLDTVLKSQNEHASSYVQSVFKSLDKNTPPDTIPKLNKAIHDNTLVTGIIPVTEEIYKYLDNTSKKMLLRVGLKQRDDRYSHYRLYNSSEDRVLKIFFDSLSRNDLVEVLGDRFIFSELGKFMAHAMTLDELYAAADKDRLFKHYNVKLLGYTYFRKYEKSKKALKELVGDRRNTENALFFSRIQTLYQEAGVSMRFIMDLEDES